ncbi:DinB family protein [Chryseobacterium cheonjiense]|uniref:Damage-inducible protein DinB n=1 Tax=Chryseobacterium cheonjiense TaxID=2728845 RepID=A0A7Y0A604_9FLAO|nr:DinB family protein [Chryseobacterium cheonjiense]NML57245.1 damage-inducible protein DinB [Chryseobacterium cheonjiense]
MIKQALLGEFLHEAENTRKLLNAIPDSALEWKPSEKNWTTGQLASHIAEVYNWYDGTFNLDVFDMGTYQYDKGDISKAQNIVEKFEENVTRAHEALNNWDESTAMNEWRMEMNGNVIFPPMPKIQVIRGFLFNHLYHHRGELVVYLRSTGNKVPGMYGPTADDNAF